MTETVTRDGWVLPLGYRLIPDRITPQMRQAGANAICRHVFWDDRIHEEVLRAAPPPPRGPAP